MSLDHQSTQPAKPGIVSDPTSARCDDLRFPICWAETGQFGTLTIPPAAWKGLGHEYVAAGTPSHRTDGTPWPKPSQFSWRYRWDGRFFEPWERIEAPAPPRPPTVWGSFAWSMSWSWLPASFIAVAAGQTGTPTAYGDRYDAGAAFTAFFLSILALWALTHVTRMNRYDPS